jgi:hypothetical protein
MNVNKRGSYDERVLEVDLSTEDDRPMKEEGNEIPRQDSKWIQLRKSKGFVKNVILLALLIDGVYYGMIIPIVPMYMKILKLSTVRFDGMN